MGLIGCKVPYMQHLIPPSQSFPLLQLGLERLGPRYQRALHLCSFLHPFSTKAGASLIRSFCLPL